MVKVIGAVAAIVTSDQKLSALKHFYGIKIVEPRDFLDRLMSLESAVTILKPHSAGHCWRQSLFYGGWGVSFSCPAMIITAV